MPEKAKTPRRRPQSCTQELAANKADAASKAEALLPRRPKNGKNCSPDEGRVRPSPRPASSSSSGVAIRRRSNGPLHPPTKIPPENAVKPTSSRFGTTFPRPYDDPRGAGPVHLPDAPPSFAGRRSFRRRAERRKADIEASRARKHAGAAQMHLAQGQQRHSR